MGLGCIMDMLIHFALTNATYGVITGSLPKYWYALSTGIYFVNAISFQLYDSSSMVSIAVSFAIKLIIFAASMYYTLSVAGKADKIRGIKICQIQILSKVLHRNRLIN